MISPNALAILSGAVVGVFLGATGGGGSLIALPLLVYLVGVPVQHATAMSLLVVGYSALFGAWRAAGQCLVKGRVALIFSSTGVVGAWVGAQGHRLIPHELILFLLGVLLVSISLWTLFAKNQNHGGKSEGGGGTGIPVSLSFILRATTFGFGVGLITGFFGIGGGFIIVPALMFVLGFPMRMAVGTSFMIIALTSVGGIVGHLDMNHLDIRLTSLVIVGSVLGMMVGGHVATMMGEQTLRKTFAVLVGLTGLFVMFDNGWRILAMVS